MRRHIRRYDLQGLADRFGLSDELAPAAVRQNLHSVLARPFTLVAPDFAGRDRQKNFYSPGPPLGSLGEILLGHTGLDDHAFAVNFDARGADFHKRLGAKDAERDACLWTQGMAGKRV